MTQSCFGNSQISFFSCALVCALDYLNPHRAQTSWLSKLFLPLTSPTLNPIPGKGSDPGRDGGRIFSLTRSKHKISIVYNTNIFENGGIHEPTFVIDGLMGNIKKGNNWNYGITKSDITILT